MTVPLDRLDLARDVDAAFTGRVRRGRGDAPGASRGRADLADPAELPDHAEVADPAGMADPANLAHHRPHVPSLLAAARREVARELALDVADLHLMRQVHGNRVGVVGPTTPAGAELRAVDAMVTADVGRALVVQAADCLPVLLALDGGPVGVAHAGRAGIASGVLAEVVAALLRLAPGRRAEDVRVALGPAVGGCCYEVPEALALQVRDEVAASSGAGAAEHAVATTTWGTCSLDLPAVAVAQLRAAGVADVRAATGCTHCDPDARWFSHRRDPGSGRHWGVVVRRHEVAA